jgi:hypothetical protein
LALMRWGLQSWSRMRRLNRMFGTRGVSAQLDLLPALRSSAFFALALRSGSPSTEAVIASGQRIQRFWLTATKLGLAIQPVFATLAFADYGSKDVPFTKDPALREKARRLAGAFREVFGAEPCAYLFLGRVGQPPPRLPGARSVRRPLSELRIGPAEQPGPS